MNENEIKNKILDYIVEEESIYTICKKVFELLSEQFIPSAFGYFFKEIYIQMSSKDCHLDEEEREILQEQTEKYGKTWREILVALLNERLEQDAFYTRLWASIAETPLFQAEEARICVLYLTCRTPCIPYHKFEVSAQIDEAQYGTYIQGLRDEIICARSLVFQPCRRYTDRASALLAQLERCRSQEERVVLFAQMIKMFEARTKRRDR